MDGVDGTAQWGLRSTRQTTNTSLPRFEYRLSLHRGRSEVAFNSLLGPLSGMGTAGGAARKGMSSIACLFRHAAPLEDSQRDDGHNRERDRADEDRPKDAEVLRGHADSNDRDRKAQIAQHKIRGDHLSPPRGWGEAVSGRKTTDEDAANRNPGASRTNQEETK